MRARAPTGAAELGFEFGAMASRCELRLVAEESHAREAAEAAVAEVRRIERRFSRYRDDSITARINAAAGGLPVEVDEETAGLLDFGATLWAASGGRFDLTSGVLRRAWRFDVPSLPAQQDLDALLPLVGWARVEWARETRQLRLPAAGMELDFGGIGKEYAADRAATVLHEKGIRQGFVNLGGDVRALGAALDGGPWRIGIRHPREASLLGEIPLTAGAVATSGDYERFIEVDGRRYCHILDPRSGWPATGWQSVSVSAPICVAAGACATVAMLMPVGEALDFLRVQRVSYLAVTAAGEVLRG